MHSVHKVLVVFTIFLICSCKKFLDVGNPTDRVAARFVYDSDISAAAVLTGIYYDLQNEGTGVSQGRSSVSLHCGLYADEYSVLPTSLYIQPYRNNSYYNFWSPVYKLIYRVNAAIEGLNSSSSLSVSVKNQLLGESKFLRAFFYFYLVNLYGDVPLLTSSEYKHNSIEPRAVKETVYAQIVDDLKEASALLSANYLASDASRPINERNRPNKWCSIALLARVYLYIKDWNASNAQATLIINNVALYDTVSLGKVFLKNSQEAIWQLQSIVDGKYYVRDARLYTLINGKPDRIINPVWLSSFLSEAFEPNDKRRMIWVGLDSSSGIRYEYFHKYKDYLPQDSASENLMVLRVAEQYLIRAEARIQIGDLKGGMDDINVIRIRAGLPVLPSSLSKDLLLQALLHERQVELFCEWGNRWFDLKRLEKIDQTMFKLTPIKGGIWESYKKELPIPLEDLKFNLNLIQNEGYPSS